MLACSSREKYKTKIIIMYKQLFRKSAQVYTVKFGTVCIYCLLIIAKTLLGISTMSFRTCTPKNERLFFVHFENSMRISKMQPKEQQ